MHSFRSMSRIEASRRNARAFRLRHSQSFANRRQRLSHAKDLSTSQRFGKMTNPLAPSDVLCQRMNCDCPFHRAAKNPARIRNKATFCKDEYALEAVMNADEACIQSNSFAARQRVQAAQHFVA